MRVTRAVLSLLSGPIWVMLPEMIMEGAEEGAEDAMIIPWATSTPLPVHIERVARQKDDYQSGLCGPCCLLRAKRYEAYLGA